MLEQAISGYATQAITDGADTTITIPNGASGVARNMSLELTGALTAARNLIVPANKKLYFVYNNTTGGFSVTVKVSGQTGVAVTNGKKVILVSNGTDVVSWALSGGATGGGSDTVFQENQLIVTTSYTLSTGKSAMSVGPITINSGVVVTVPSGYRWMVL